ncbi:hypothetical protein BSKO_05417 [Bryopsis sp. KO-2023]|nr:hypothetical protein BSKO_05417 [Bryopsis sp. KO-2023]
MFGRCRTKGAVTMTIVRRNLKAKKHKREGEEIEFYLVIKAGDGKKNISTTVQIVDYKRFNDSFMTIIKAHSDGLKEKRKEEPKGKKKEN